ncbi:MAG: segregation/condensation protein A [Candidatus Altiarchaeota archaeon]|nr:segregation/condensation protein A [Candidatus Altiarchaeota archaeon]
MDPVEIAIQDLHKVEPRIVNLISEREIDPWDVDIIKLCKLYIDEIKKRADLRISGNAILTAAVLLRLKSTVFDEEEPDSIKDPGMILGVPDIEIVPISRRVERKITVVELLDALNSAFQLEKGKALARKARPDIKFYAIDLSQFMEKLLMELPDSIVIEAMGPLILFSLLELANRDVVEVEQEDWNGSIRVRKLGGSRIVHGGQEADSRRNI